MKYNRTKALHSLLYLCKRLPQPVDVYTALKVIYFADKLHLERFGRLMFGDRYIAMENGPVPSGAYDIVKYVGGRSVVDLAFPEAAEKLYSTRTDLIPKGAPDRELFSRSELICLAECASKYGSMSFTELKKISHDEAWKKADANGEIDIEHIALMLQDGSAIVGHLNDRSPGAAVDEGRPSQQVRQDENVTTP